MIEGHLEDISLPGLLQSLAAESTKNYRLRINRGGQHGDIFVCEGHVLVATYGILEGLDALSEFLNWSDGQFVVEKLPSHFKSTIRSNISLNLAEPGCFSDQCAFLYESNVGLNTEIVPSRSFGTAEWQEALHVQPLSKEDYAILGWITDGRTMRQAMREFQFDLKKAIGVLYRLLITRSVEVVRPTAFSEPPQVAVDELAELATKELAKHTQDVPRKKVTVEFHATDIGGARPKPRTADDTATTLPKLEAPAVPTPEPLTPKADKKVEGDVKVAAAQKDEKAEPTKDDTKTEARKTSVATAEKVEAKSDTSAKPAAAVAAPKADSPESKNKPSLFDRLKDLADKVDAETEKNEARAEKTVSKAIEGEDSEVADNFKKQLKKGGKQKSAKDTQDLPALEAEEAEALTRAVEEEIQDADIKELEKVEPPEVSKVLEVVAAPTKAFDERRTDPLPLISIDIERLLNSAFQLTNIGTLALTNPSIDELLKLILLDVERGKTLLLVLTDSNRSDAAVLATYRYCLDRGYIEHSDPVMSLTVDLLIGRLEIEQYLLQRRRITGDQLRDMTAISHRQGISLDKLLVAAGYMLPIDMERVIKEKERFSQR